MTPATRNRYSLPLSFDSRLFSIISVDTVSVWICCGKKVGAEFKLLFAFTGCKQIQMSTHYKITKMTFTGDTVEKDTHINNARS